MNNAPSKVLVRTILEHSQDYDWRMQEIGLLGLRLDERREYRLHVWDPGYSEGEPVIHDHPYDFTSTIVVGELVNTRYKEDPSGTEYGRVRYSPADEDTRTTDTVRLSAQATTLREGDCYSQLAHELHDSRQVSGTVTILRMAFKEHGVSQLTVCRRDDPRWVSGQARPATTEEVKRITTAALSWF